MVFEGLWLGLVDMEDGLVSLIAETQRIMGGWGWRELSSCEILRHRKNTGSC